MVKLTQLLVGMVIVLSAVGVNYFIAEGDTAYSCEEEKVTLCWKLSKINSNNISRNCYYNISAPRTYKLCRTGWNLFEDKTLTGDITEIDSEVEFKEFPEIGEVEIVSIWKRLDDKDITIQWKLEVFNKRDNVTDIIRKRFQIPTEQIDNITFIQDILEPEVKKAFEKYNKSFIPNPIIEYKDHPLWK